MKYRIGLDLGIASVGWAVLQHDIDGNPTRIVDLGVRTFDAAENPKTGDSLALARRTARGLRRRLRRKADRILKIKRYMGSLFFNNENYILSNNNMNVFDIRYRGISEQISKEELYKVITYFVKHRGFKSNRKSEISDKDTGKMLKAMISNVSKAENYRTIGEYIYCDSRFFTIKEKNGKTYREYKVRNHSNYDNSFPRVDIEKELRLILQTQSQYYPEILTTESINHILDIFNQQRSFDDGPNEPSPYKSNFAVGKCTLMTDKYRAPKGSFTFEYFNILKKLNDLTIIDSNKQEIKLGQEDKAKLLEKVFDGKDIKFSQVKKIVGLADDCIFKNLSYKYKNNNEEKKKKQKTEDQNTIEQTNIEQSEELKNSSEASKIQPLKKEIDINASETATFIKFNKVKEMQEALQLDSISSENMDLYDAIAYILSMRKSDDRRINAFKLEDNIIDTLSDKQKDLIQNLSKEQIDHLLKIDIAQFGNLCLEAMQSIIPYMEKGYTYDKACDQAGFDFRAISKCNKTYKLKYNELVDELSDITSPVVKRTISQTIKVINAIIDNYGSPEAIFIEFARELGKNFKDRDTIKKSQELRRSDNERIEQKLRTEFNITPSGLDIVKYKLYEEQGGKCAYSGKSFEKELGSVKNIFNNNTTQIDHIIPYSKCFDDSYNNKVLVLTQENQKKGNRVPMEYMSEEQFKNFEEFVKVQYVNNPKKQEKLLHKPLTEDQITELNSRSLNDTRYSVKLIKQVVENHLIFADSKFRKSPVRCVNGGITSYLRKIWGLTKNRLESDKHHAQDAVVIATATNNMINQITRYFQYKSYLTRSGALKYENINGVPSIIVKETGETFTEDEYNIQFGAKIVKPYEKFREEIEARLLSNNPLDSIYIDVYKTIGYTNDEIDAIKPILISRMPTRKVLGKIHKDTIKSKAYQKDDNKRYVTTKTDIKELKLENGEIEGYSEKAKKDDKLLYNALKNRLVQFNGDAKKAFEQPFYKPKADGTNGNIVRSVRIEEVASDYIEVNNGTANNDGMVRIDVFGKDGKNYIVPVYTKDVYAGVLPTLAVVSGKPKSEWIDISKDGYEFKFSVYPNDLLYSPDFENWETAKKKKSNTKYLYYNSFDINTAGINLFNHDNSLMFKKGSQRISNLQKCTVDILGNISFVRHNTRQELNIKKKGKR